MSEAGTGRSFTEALRAELAAYQENDLAEPDQVPAAPPRVWSQIAREFARAQLEALDPEPSAEPDHAAPATSASALGSEFEEALRRGRDGASAAAAGSARTTEQSGWITDVCPVCRHSFRQSDVVWLELRDGQVLVTHDSADLPCRSGSGLPEPPPPVLAPVAAAFLDALRMANPGIRGQAVKRLRPGHPLLSGQFRQRARCPGCNHTFRPYDRVAFCPCNPAAPTCRLAAHHDPGASMLCFEALASPDRKHCPMDYHKLQGRTDARTLHQARPDPGLESGAT